jgi:hypothetical protein
VNSIIGGGVLAMFTTRVELHRAYEDDYEILHATMEQRGFSRQITSDDGITYHLPTAEDNYAGNKTRSQILELAKAAASETNKKFAVLVTESNARSWSGLERI